MVGINSKQTDSFLNRILNNALKKQNESLQKLASGKNPFMSDPAGGAIAADLDQEIGVRKVAERNAYDGVAVANLRDSALSQVSNLQDRQAELAAQASSGTYSDGQRASLDEEFQANAAEINRIIETTEFNGQKLFSGTSITTQVGTESSQTSQITLKGVAAGDIFASKSIASSEGAKAALEQIKVETKELSNLRAEDGAATQRLEQSIRNNETASLNLTEAASRIRDVNFAEEITRLLSSRIQSDAATAMAAQAGKINNPALIQRLLS